MYAQASSSYSVLFDAFWLEGGPLSNTRVMRSQIEAWVAEFPDDQVHVATTRRGLDRLAPEVRTAVEWVKIKSPQHALFSTLELPLNAWRLNVDIAIAQNFGSIVGPASVVYEHDLMFMDHPEWFTWQERLYFKFMHATLRKARTIVTSTDTEVRRIRRFVDTPTYSAGGLAVDRSLSQAFPVQVERLDPYRFFLAVGRLNARKNLNFGIEVAHRAGLIDEQRPLVIAGRPDGLAELGSQRVIDLEGSGAVVFLGEVSEGQLSWLYRHACGVVFPTLDEGFGLPAVEAAFFGAPLLSSDIPVLREVSAPGTVFMDPMDLEIAATQAQQFNPRTGPDQNDGRRQWAERKFSWSEHVKRLRSIAKEVCDEA